MLRERLKSLVGASAYVTEENALAAIATFATHDIFDLKKREAWWFRRRVLLSRYMRLDVRVMKKTLTTELDAYLHEVLRCLKEENGSSEDGKDPPLIPSQEDVD